MKNTVDVKRLKEIKENVEHSINENIESESTDLVYWLSLAKEGLSNSIAIIEESSDVKDVDKLVEMESASS